MNYILVAALIILAVCIFTGWRKGFIRTIFSTFLIIFSLFVAMQTYSMLSKQLQKTFIYNALNERVSGVLFKDSEGEVNRVTDQIDTINGLPLPESIKKYLVENNNVQIYDALGISDFESYVSGYLSCLIINAISFVGIFLIMIVLLKIIEASLDLMSKLPVLNGINKIGGVLIGVIKGFLILWVVCIVVTIFSGTSWGKFIFEGINESWLLGLIYNNNYLLLFIANMGRILF